MQLPLRLHDAAAPLSPHPVFASVAPISGGLVRKTPPQLEASHLFLYRDTEIFDGLLSRTSHSDQARYVEYDKNDVIRFAASGGTPAIENALTWLSRRLNISMSKVFLW